MVLPLVDEGTLIQAGVEVGVAAAAKTTKSQDETCTMGLSSVFDP